MRPRLVARGPPRARRPARRAPRPLACTCIATHETLPAATHPKAPPGLAGARRPRARAPRERAAPVGRGRPRRRAPRCAASVHPTLGRPPPPAPHSPPSAAPRSARRADLGRAPRGGGRCRPALSPLWDFVSGPPPGPRTPLARAFACFGSCPTTAARRAAARESPWPHAPAPGRARRAASGQTGRRVRVRVRAGAGPPARTRRQLGLYPATWRGTKRAAASRAGAAAGAGADGRARRRHAPPAAPLRRARAPRPPAPPGPRPAPVFTSVRASRRAHAPSQRPRTVHNPKGRRNGPAHTPRPPCAAAGPAPLAGPPLPGANGAHSHPDPPRGRPPLPPSARPPSFAQAHHCRCARHCRAPTPRGRAPKRPPRGRGRPAPRRAPTFPARRLAGCGWQKKAGAGRSPPFSRRTSRRPCPSSSRTLAHLAEAATPAGRHQA